MLGPFGFLTDWLRPAPPVPWTCPECGAKLLSDASRAHMATHRARLMSEQPLVVELRCWDHARDLGPAIAELKRRWPGRKFQLLPGSYAEGSHDGERLRSIIAIEDDWTIPHDPFGP